MTITQGQAETWLEEVEDHGINLSPWEEEFIESMREWMDGGSLFTIEQMKMIERVYSDRTP